MLKVREIEKEDQRFLLAMLTEVLTHQPQTMAELRSVEPGADIGAGNWNQEEEDETWDKRNYENFH